MSSNKLFFFIVTCAIIAITNLPGCYSFKGTSISPQVQSFSVKDFRMSTPEAPANINLDFTTRLREKIERESRLKYSKDNPDIIFSGSLNGFTLKAEAPTGQRTSAIDRLTIRFEVEYKNKVNDEHSWKKNFSHFADISSNDNFIDRQDELIDIIYEQITEDIFSSAFSNW